MKRQIVTIVDDLDGSEADRTIAFAVDGDAYEIDVSYAHADEFSGVLAPYINAGRRVGGRAGSGRRGGASAKRQSVDSQAVRDWGRAQGHEVSDRGRISTELRDAYDAAH